MKKILLTTLMTTGLIGTTLAVANEQGELKRDFGNCDNGGYMQGERGGMKKHHAKRGGKGHGMRGDMYRGLDLSDAQKEQIKTLFSEGKRSEQADVRKQQRELADKRRVLIQSKTFDKAAFEKLLAEQDKLRSEQRLKQAELRHKAWNVLTPEQQKKAQERFSEHRELMEKQREFQQKWKKKD